MAIVGVLNGHNSVAIGTATDEMVMQVIHGSRIALHLDVWSSSVQSYTRARSLAPNIRLLFLNDNSWSVLAFLRN